MIDILKEAFALLPEKMRSPAAGQEVLAIVFQESDGLYRRQHGNGPARGLAQFELGGGVKGVMTHKASAKLAAEVCVARGVDPKNLKQIWERLEFDDVLAFALARLLLWTDSGKLPESQSDGWEVYLRVWRPGKPHADKWGSSWYKAQGVMDGR
jgi:hypothetical protein